MRDEADFILAILTYPGDEDRRLVYADWLAERGDPPEYLCLESDLTQLLREEDLCRNSGKELASSLRIQEIIRKYHSEEDVQQTPDDPNLLELESLPFNFKVLEVTSWLQERIRNLRSQLPLRWLVWLDRPAVENCGLIRLDYVCKQGWDQMILTDQENVRLCEKCGEDVHYCNTVEEAHAAASADHCVCIPVNLTRSRDDIPERAVWIEKSISGLFDKTRLHKREYCPPVPCETERQIPSPLVHQLRGDENQGERP